MIRAPLGRLSLLSWLVAGLGACASVGSYVPPVDGAPAADVVGEDPGFLDGLDPLASVSTTWFVRVDDDALSRSAWSGYPNLVRVPAGQHELEVGGSVRQRGRVIATGSAVFRVAFEAGRTYRATTHATTGLGPGQPGQVVIQLETSDTAGEAAAGGSGEAARADG